MADSPNATGWACGLCTLINDAADAVCTACGGAQAAGAEAEAGTEEGPAFDTTTTSAGSGKGKRRAAIALDDSSSCGCGSDSDIEVWDASSAGQQKAAEFFDLSASAPPAVAAPATAAAAAAAVASEPESEQSDGADESDEAVARRLGREDLRAERWRQRQQAADTAEAQRLNAREQCKQQRRAELTAAADGGRDVLREVRASLPAFLAGDAAKGIEWLGEPEPSAHAVPGEPLYERFLTAWVESNMDVRLVFHGTAEANVDAICKEGLDPVRRAGQAMGPGEYFAGAAATSVPYCKGGSQMLVFAVLTDPSGITLDNGAFVVVHKVERQLRVVLCCSALCIPSRRSRCRLCFSHLHIFHRWSTSCRCSRCASATTRTQLTGSWRRSSRQRWRLRRRRHQGSS
jgi:hypothetical protein